MTAACEVELAEVAEADAEGVPEVEVRETEALLEVVAGRTRGGPVG